MLHTKSATQNSARHCPSWATWPRYIQVCNKFQWGRDIYLGKLRKSDTAEKREQMNIIQFPSTPNRHLPCLCDLETVTWRTEGPPLIRVNGTQRFRNSHHVQCLTILLISGELSICPFLYMPAAERLICRVECFCSELRLRRNPPGLAHILSAAASLVWKGRVAGLYETSGVARKTKPVQTYDKIAAEERRDNIKYVWVWNNGHTVRNYMLFSHYVTCSIIMHLNQCYSAFQWKTVKAVGEFYVVEWS